MKRILKLFIIVLPLVCLQGCQKWLEATSSSQISGEQLFSDRAGFHEALSGVYMLMGSTSCYGRNYTWFVNELTASPLIPQNGNIYQQLQNQKYTNAVSFPYFESMWESGYNVIANVNKMLLELENHRDVITDDLEYSLIKGELLAIRAYLHFDLLKMFGLPSWDGENASKLAIPYVTVYQKEPSVQHSYTETVALLNADIDQALELLAVDPIRGSVPEGFDEALNADGFWSRRTFHLNWYAVRALKARVLMWQKKYDEAAALAREILDETLEKEVVHWIDPVEQLNTIKNDDRDYTFSCEHLFTLEISDYFDIVSEYFFKEAGNGSNNLLLSSEVVFNLFQSPYIYTDEGYTTLVGDIRGPAMMLTYGQSGYRINKYFSSSSGTYRNRQPMIRIAELCMICAEVAIRKGDLDTAADYFNMVNSHRGVEDKVTPKNSILGQSPHIFFWEEFVREFIAEGQIYYLRKRCGRYLTDSASNVVVELFPFELDLLYPYPTEETSYGHIQEK